MDTKVHQLIIIDWSSRIMSMLITWNVLELCYSIMKMYSRHLTAQEKC